MAATLLRHVKHPLAPYSATCLLGPSRDGNYIFCSENGQKTSVAHSSIRLLPAAAHSVTQASQCLFDLTKEILRFDSGYRSFVDQVRAFRSALIRSGDFPRTIRRVATAGYSEHHTGLAIDLANGLEIAPTLLPFFGWELSFPPDNLQGIRHEPWHWRYIGSPAIMAALDNPKLSHSPFRDYGSPNLSTYKPAVIPSDTDNDLGSSDTPRDLAMFIAECLLELGRAVPGYRFNNYRHAVLEEGISYLNSLGVQGTDHAESISMVLEMLTPLLPGERNERVQRLQRQLARLGLFSNSATGFYGEKTAEAVRRFHSLSRTPNQGLADVGLLRGLRIRSATALEMTPASRITEIVGGEWFNGYQPTYGLVSLANGRYACHPNDGELLVASCKVDGWDFAERLFPATDKPLASALLVDTEPLSKSLPLPVLKVPSTRRAIGLLAQHARSLLKGKVIAITGSSGKTTTKEVLRTILSSQGATVATPGSANSLMAICYQLLNWSMGADYYVCECGLGATGSTIDQQSQLLQPDISIVTSVHAAHSEGYQSIEEIARRKVEIAKHLQPNGYLFLDGGSAHLKLMTELARQWGVKNIITFGQSLDCDARVVRYQTQGLLGKAQLDVFGEKLDLLLQMPGSHWAQMAVIVAACGRLLGLNLQRVLDDLKTVCLPPGRGTVSGQPGRSIVLFDSHYNANPGSMCADLEAFSQLELPESIKKIGIIGSMKELGAFSDAAHREMVPRILAAGFSRLLLVGEETRQLLNVFSGIAVTEHASADEAIHCLRKELTGTECIFVKGSHSNDLEKVSRFLSGNILRAMA